MTMLGHSLLVRTVATGLPRSLIAAVVASLVVMLVVLAANYMTLRGDAAALRDATRHAFESGALPTYHTNAPDRRVGAFTYHDCLILSMALERRPSLVQRVVSPARPRSRNPSAEDPGACARLFDMIVHDNYAAYVPSPYHRYISGAVAPAALMVPILGVNGYRSLLRAANYALCGALWVTTLLTFLRIRLQTGPVRRKMAAGAILFGIMLVFSGMEFYAQNLSIGLADLFVYALFGTLILTRPVEMSRRRIMAVSGAAFAMIGALEYWTGQIPVALAGGIGLIALDAAAVANRSQVWRRIIDFTMTAMLTILVLFGLKIGIASLVFDHNVLASFVRLLGARAGGADFGVGRLLLHLGGSLDYIGQGSLLVGLLQAVGAMVAAALGLRMIFSPSQTDPMPRTMAWGLILSIAVVVSWHLVFRNQSTLHASFMVRTLSWPAAAGWILLAVGRESRPGRPSWSGRTSRRAPLAIESAPREIPGPR